LAIPIRLIQRLQALGLADGSPEGRLTDAGLELYRTSPATSRAPEVITGEQIRAARKLLGWHRGQIAQRARGITGNTIGNAEGDYPGEPPTSEQLAEIRAVLEAAGVEFTSGDEPGVKLKASKARKAGK
jgi:hypothetical protein